MIEFHCNICNKKISVPNQYLGKAVKCLSCGNILKAIPEIKIEQAEDPSEGQEAGPEKTPQETPGSEETSAPEQTEAVSEAELQPSGFSLPAGRKKPFLLALVVLILGLTIFLFPASYFGKENGTPAETTPGSIPSPAKPPGKMKARPTVFEPPAKTNGNSGMPAARVSKPTEVPKHGQPLSTQGSETVISVPQPTQTPTPIVKVEAPANPTASPVEPNPVNAAIESPEKKVTEKERKIPERPAQVEALKQLRILFKEEYKKTKPEDRKSLAGELLKRGTETRDDSAMSYVLFRESMELAAEAEDKDTALAAAEKLAALYQLDPMETKMDALTLLGDAKRNGDSAKELAESFLQLADEAVAADKYKVAYKSATAAWKFSVLAKDDALMAQTKLKPVEVKKLAGEFDGLKGIRKTLEHKPDDPKANLAMGKFLCLGKGNWEEGLPKLLKGSDEELKALAQKELDYSPDSKSQVDLGDKWWELGTDVKDKLLQSRYKKRAVYWYQQVGDLSGLTQVRVEKRIQEVEKSVPSAPPERIVKRRVVNLLKLVDTQQDPVFGFWRRNTSGELISDNTNAARIEIPYQPPEEYDFRVTFTRASGNDAILLVLSNPSAQCQFTWILGGWGNTVSALTQLGLRSADNNPTTLRKLRWLLNRNKYLAVVQVRKGRVRLLLNNELVTEWKTDYTDLSPAPYHDLRNKNFLGVGSWASSTIFHKIEVLELSGPGTVEERKAGEKFTRNKKK